MAIPGDELFEQFVQAYPASRRQRGYMAETLFLLALQKVSFEMLLAAVAQHKRSEQWQDARLIPMLKTWLQEERWIQVLPEPRRGVGAKALQSYQVPRHEPL